MAAGGHTERFRMTVLELAVQKYTNLLTADREGGEASTGVGKRELQDKESGGKTRADNWHKQGGRQFTSTLRIPYTTDSKLKLGVQKTLDKVQGPRGTNIKLVKEVGSSTKQQLVKSEPFPREWCGRLSCPITYASVTCREKCYTTKY